MELLLPDDKTIELMRKEFAKLKPDVNALAFALERGGGADSVSGEEAPIKPPMSAGEGAYISGLLLLLYFVKHLSYNTGYGTQIFDTDGSMAQLQSVAGNFRRINGL